MYIWTCWNKSKGVVFQIEKERLNSSQFTFDAQIYVKRFIRTRSGRVSGLCHNCHKTRVRRVITHWQLYSSMFQRASTKIQTAAQCTTFARAWRCSLRWRRHARERVASVSMARPRHLCSSETTIQMTTTIATLRPQWQLGTWAFIYTPPFCQKGLIKVQFLIQNGAATIEHTVKSHGTVASQRLYRLRDCWQVA